MQGLALAPSNWKKQRRAKYIHTLRVAELLGSYSVVGPSYSVVWKERMYAVLLNPDSLIKIGTRYTDSRSQSMRMDTGPHASVRSHGKSGML